MILSELFDNMLFEQYIQVNYRNSTNAAEVIDFFKTEDKSAFRIIEFIGKTDDFEKEFSHIERKATEKTMIHILLPSCAAMKDIKSLLDKLDGFDTGTPAGLYILSDADEGLGDNECKVRVISSVNTN